MTGPQIETGGRLADPGWLIPAGPGVRVSGGALVAASHSPVGAGFSRVFCWTTSHSLAASALRHPKEEHG